jgi:hypothetical protein
MLEWVRDHFDEIGALYLEAETRRGDLASGADAEVDDGGDVPDRVEV